MLKQIEAEQASVALGRPQDEVLTNQFLLHCGLRSCFVHALQWQVSSFQFDRHLIDSQRAGFNFGRSWNEMNFEFKGNRR